MQTAQACPGLVVATERTRRYFPKGRTDFKLNNRDFIRETTREIHQTLDSQIGAAGVFENTTNYCNFLSCMAAMHVQFADSCRKVSLSAGLPRREADLATCLVNDIASTNERSEIDIAGSALTAVASDSQASAFDWGCAYAIEGSANGARYMKKSAEKTLPADIEFQYLKQMAWDAANRWPPFIKELNERSELDREQLERGATEVFCFVKKHADQLFPV